MIDKAPGLSRARVVDRDARLDKALIFALRRDMRQLNSEETVQGSFFDSRGMSITDAAAGWTQALSVLFDVRIGGDVDHFQGLAGGYALDQLLLGRSRSIAQTFDRSRYRTASDGLSNYLLQFYIEGACGQRHATSDAWTRPGDLLIIDLAQPLATAASAFENLNLFVPRRLLAPLLTAPDALHLTVLRREEPLVALLLGHLRMLMELAPSLTRGQAAKLVGPTVELAAAAINGQIDETWASSVNQSLLEQICHGIEAQLTDRSLTAEAVAGRFGISERKLYYLFKDLGGFSGYVRQRRLHAVRARLAEPRAQGETIASISEAYGFTHRSSFVSAFRSLYGMTPREFRSLAAARAPLVDAGLPSDWRRWIAELR